MGLRLNAASAERQLQILANKRSVSAFDLRGPMEPKAHGSPFFAEGLLRGASLNPFRARNPHGH